MNIVRHVTYTATSPAEESTVASDAFGGLGRFYDLVIDATLRGATGGTLDVVLQRDVGGTWVDWYKFPQLAAAANDVHYTLSTDAAATSETVVGHGTTTAIADSTLTCRLPGDRIRMLMIAGASTTEGAEQVIRITGFERN